MIKIALVSYESLLFQIWYFLSLCMVLVFLITFILQDLASSDDEYYIPMQLVLNVIELICVAFFTIEFVLRFVNAPNKIRFFRNAMNWIDFLAIIPFYVNCFLQQIDDMVILGKAGKTIRLLRVLRIIRIFKLIRHFAGLQSLVHTVYEAYKELGLLMVLVLLCELCFAVLIFYAEKEAPKSTKSIFKHDENRSWTFVECLWFCLMTLTTVGDDRKYPTTNFGQLIGGCCAVMGTFIISLPIPIVVNSFARCYNNQLWRGEVSQRRRMLINQMKRKRMMDNAKAKFIGCTSNMMFLSTIVPNVMQTENIPVEKIHSPKKSVSIIKESLINLQPAK